MKRSSAAVAAASPRRDAAETSGVSVASALRASGLPAAAMRVSRRVIAASSGSAMCGACSAWISRTAASGAGGDRLDAPGVRAAVATADPRASLNASAASSAGPNESRCALRFVFWTASSRMRRSSSLYSAKRADEFLRARGSPRHSPDLRDRLQGVDVRPYRLLCLFGFAREGDGALRRCPPSPPCWRHRPPW